jgi:hypothetical protein
MSKITSPVLLSSSARPPAGFRSTALILLSALAASAIPLVRDVSCGHDFNFHLISWFEVQRSWSQGVLYPHWAQSPNWGAGEARFVFYPPLTWTLGALLGYLIPWSFVPTVLVFLSLAASGLATRLLARQFLPGPSATLAGILATATPYALFTANERTSFAELAAAAFIPLLLYFALRPPKAVTTLTHSRSKLASSAWNGSTAPLALVLCLTWLTNAPAGVMASYLLAFAALVASLVLRAWWPVLRAIAAAITGIGLAAFYLVPAAWEQRWIAIQQAIDVGMSVRDSWLFMRHTAADLKLHDQVLLVASCILVFTAVMAAIGFLLALRQGKLGNSATHLWLPLALLIPVIVLLQFPFSAPVWNLLPRLQFLQFPWRLLMVLGAPYAIFLAAAIPVGSRRARRLAAAGCGALVLAVAGLATIFFVQPCDQEDQVSNQTAVFHAGTGVEGTDEYAALNADNSLIPDNLPDGCLVTDPAQHLGEGDPDTTPDWYPEQGSCDETYTAQLWLTEHKQLKINADHPGFVILRLRRYPAWQILLNGQPAPPAPAREDGLIDVPVPAGPSTIEIRWATTPDVLKGRAISLAALILLASLWLFERRRKTTRFS